MFSDKKIIHSSITAEQHKIIRLDGGFKNVWQEAFKAVPQKMTGILKCLYTAAGCWSKWRQWMF